MKQFLTLASVTVLSTSLAACGGGAPGATGIASTPPPLPASPSASPATAPSVTSTGTAQTTPNTRTPLPSTPATTSGTYAALSTFTSTDGSGQTIVRDSTGRVVSVSGDREITAPHQLAPQGSIILAVDASSKTYTLTVGAGPYSFPAGKLTMPADSDIGYTRNNSVAAGLLPAEQVARGDVLVQNVGAGAASNGALRVVSSFLRLYNVGRLADSPQYLSAATWGQSYRENASGISGADNYKPTQETTGLMVFGPRTAPEDIPVSGTARYALDSLTDSPSAYFLVPDDLANRASREAVMDVDFASRKLTATYDLTTNSNLYTYQDDGFAAQNIADGKLATVVHASGSTIVGTNGAFSLALAGTGTVHVERTDLVSVPDISKSVTGDMTGGFFGPKAAEVGGLWDLPTIQQDGSVIINSDAFAGVRKTP